MSHQYLEYIRTLNRAQMNQCYICQDKTVDIIANGYLIEYVCKTHYDLHQETREITPKGSIS